MAVTIYDVAKEAGVSIATVSKALNDSYTIPDQTKAAIREIADRLGYRPNARAKNFARQASGTVLFITDFYQNIAFENPHMFEIISGIATYLDGKDYSLTLKPLTKQAAPLYIRDIIQQRQADALIIHAFVLSPRAGRDPFPGGFPLSGHRKAGIPVQYLLDRRQSRAGGADCRELSAGQGLPENGLYHGAGKRRPVPEPPARNQSGHV